MQSNTRKWQRGGRSLVRPDAMSSAASRAFDRIGDRAWTLALWLTGDERQSGDAVAAAFSMRASDPDCAWDDDGELLREVRLQALGRIVAPRVDAGGATAAELAAMAPQQREVMELAVVGRVLPDTIARLTGSTPREVMELLKAGLGQLAASGLAGSMRVQV